MKTAVAITVAMMLVASSASAQGPRILNEWVLPSPGQGLAEGVAAGPDGGVVVAGIAGSSPRVVHFDAHFKVMDDWLLPGSDARPRAVTALPGAVAMIAGPGEPPGWERGLAVWRFAVGEDGHLKQEWQRRFRRTGLDGGTGAAALPDGGVVVAGWTGGGQPTTSAGWIVRLDAEGDPGWRKLAHPYTVRGIFEARAAARSVNGDILVAAHGTPGPDQPGGVWVLRFDMQGNDTAQKVIEEQDDTWPESLAALSDGGYAVAGRLSPPADRRGSQAWLVRCNADGNIVWDRHWGEHGRNGIEAVAALADDTLLVAGWLDGSGGQPEAWLARIDEHGLTMWEHRFKGTGRLRAVAQLPDGTAVAAGARVVGGREQMWLVRLGY